MLLIRIELGAAKETCLIYQFELMESIEILKQFNEELLFYKMEYKKVIFSVGLDVKDIFLERRRDIC